MSVRVVVPQVGQSIAEATIVKWFKKPGDPVEKGEILVEIGTDKINTEIPAPESGVVQRLFAQEGDTVPVQTEIAEIETVAKTPEPPASQPTETTTSQRHSPVVRRLAQENNIDLATIHGSGEGGRITKEDVQRVIDSRQQAAPVLTSEAVPMSRMRKLIAEHMLKSKRSTAELTTFFEIDMSEVARQREKAKDIYEKQYGIKLTYLPFVVAAVAKALKLYPVLNSSIDGESIVYKKECNVGIAMAVEDGLLVPVVRNADTRNVRSIAQEASMLAERARTKRLSAEDLADGTFTITNPGVFGALMGTPIISYPQVAILGIGAVVKRPVVIHDAIAIRSMAYFSLTYDHRAMDGAVADSFLAHIKKTLETSCPPALD